jgi:hypothetical protein
MSTARFIAVLLICAAGLLARPPAAMAQSADLALRIQLVPDEPLDAGDQGDIVFTVENLGPDASGPINIVSTAFVRVSGTNGVILFRLTRASTDPCPLLLLSAGDPRGGEAFFSTAFIELPSITPGQRLSCRIRIDVAVPLANSTVLRFATARIQGSPPDLNPANNLVSLAIGSDAPRVIPAGGPVVHTLLAVLLGALGARSVRRRCGAGR